MTADPSGPGPYPPPEPHVSDQNRPVVEEFRANDGRVGGPFEGGDLLLLTTVGARSGRQVTVPLGYVRDGDRLLVVGSAGGSPRHPAWYHNLLAHPMVRVEVGAGSFAAVAVPAEGEERDRLFDRVVRVAPGYGDYQERAGRLLPVVALERSYDDAAGAATTLADTLVVIHTWLRHQLRQVREETEAYLAGAAAGEAPGTPPPVGLSLRIRQHCLAFCGSLRFHHDGEDAAVLPALAARHPHLAGAIERLRAEHRTVERIQDGLAALLADVATADPARFRAELDRMSRELLTHLDFEERTLLPVLAEVPFPPAPAGPADGGR